MGALLVGAIGTVIGWGVKKLTESTLTAVALTGLFLAAMTLLPFSVEMPSEMYRSLMVGEIGSFFASVGYMIPLKTILTSVCLITLCRYSKILINLVIHIFNWLLKIVNGSK